MGDIIQHDFNKQSNRLASSNASGISTTKYYDFAKFDLDRERVKEFVQSTREPTLETEVLVSVTKYVYDLLDLNLDNPFECITPESQTKLLFYGEGQPFLQALKDIESYWKLPQGTLSMSNGRTLFERFPTINALCHYVLSKVS